MTIRRISEFTQEEKTIIDDIVYRKLEDMTADEVQLYSEWQAAKTIESEEFRMVREAFENEMIERRNMNNAYYEQAFANLQAEADAAALRLERVLNNGQE